MFPKGVGKCLRGRRFDYWDCGVEDVDFLNVGGDFVVLEIAVFVSFCKRARGLRIRENILLLSEIKRFLFIRSPFQVPSPESPIGYPARSRRNSRASMLLGA